MKVSGSYLGQGGSNRELTVIVSLLLQATYRRVKLLKKATTSFPCPQFIIRKSSYLSIFLT
jgi:hypothetical protein